MKLFVFILLVCLLVEYNEGMMIVPKTSCLCSNAGVSFIKPGNIAKIVVYRPSSFCQKMEIIVTMKHSGFKKCLNAETRFAKTFLKHSKMNRRMKKM
ncbi:C-X-C motif chemokine 11-6-like [Brienomyrus brachyistius]|uniref:C-X-C motif chemokine 11-6-like n=1 Tax=Brienomyrus brachyistius TaxID=42636 RepID=UPI0020B2FF01|nr:C-X-C motif chemokine 11-6-like [Brienomyrus brachyistius]